VPRQHVADAGDAAIFTAPHGEPFQREGRPGAVSQQVLEGLTLDTQMGTNERDPDACVHRKPTVLSIAHVGGRIGGEEPLHAAPPHDTTAHLPGERGQIRLGDRTSRQLSEAGGFAIAPRAERIRRPVNSRQEDAVGRLRLAGARGD
jgi:hypothetical protein